LRARVDVLSTRLFAGRTIVRVRSDSLPEAGFEPAAPELDDAYFAAIHDPGQRSTSDDAKAAS
jgi:hypothetical protein